MDSKQLMHYINQVIAIAVTLLLFSYLGRGQPVGLEVESPAVENTPSLEYKVYLRGIGLSILC
ncbi:hypothetical protein Lepto7375DRAFT_4500 [Leptolyngbya sp. PCC 7375]|nr:hypothetical protein Lepto7375DRAFT_4500 [Leptolyngbya sp. PCC 7375]